jgi:hypothetical protein
MAACSLLALSGLSSSGVVQRAGLFKHGSAIAPIEAKDLHFGNDLFVRSNIPTRRDFEVLMPWIATELGSAIKGNRRNGSLPLKIASYQAGFFPWALRQHFVPEEVLFIDLAGLSDFRIGGLPGEKSPLGLHEGIRLWAESISLGQGALGRALVDCRPDMVYVLRASKRQRLLMKQADFDVVYEKSTQIGDKRFSAVVFQSQHQNDGKCPLLGVG